MMIFIIITSIIFTFQSSQVCLHPWDLPKKKKKKTKTQVQSVSMIKLTVAGLWPWCQGAPRQVRERHTMQTAHMESFIRREGERGERKGVQNGLWGEKDREGERENGRGASFSKEGHGTCARRPCRSPRCCCVLVMHAGVAHTAGLGGAGQVCLNTNIGTFPFLKVRS